MMVYVFHGPWCMKDLLIHKTPDAFRQSLAVSSVWIMTFLAKNLRVSFVLLHSLLLLVVHWSYEQTKNFRMGYRQRMASLVLSALGLTKRVCYATSSLR